MLKRIVTAITALSLLVCTFSFRAAALVDANGFEAEIVRLVNEERAKEGMVALNYGNSALNAAAIKRVEEYAANPYLRHTRPNNGSFSTVFAEYGIEWRECGENVASGHRSPAQVVEAWMNSESHRKNIMGGSAGFNWIDVAVYEDDNGRLYWVQLFVLSNTLSNGDTAPSGEAIAHSGSEPGETSGTGFFMAFIHFVLGIWSAITGFFSRA